MATVTLTFTVPAELARRFLRQVPPRKRSRYVSDALARRLAEEEARLIHACAVANGDPDVTALETELGALAEF